jgi:hypothetical protein
MGCNEGDAGGAKEKCHLFLTWALGGGERSTSRRGHFTPRKEPQRPLNSGQVGPKTDLDFLENRKTCFPCWDSIPE